MTEIQNFAQAEDLLASYIPQVSELLGKDLTLKRMAPLMEVLGNPENKVKLIHVAGTSGKTSTCYYITSLLMAAGQKVGLTVSPHIDSVAERVQVNLEPLPEEEFCRNLAEFIELIKSVEPRPTYFELIIAFAYWYFAKAGLNYAVIETGLGGSFDATNVAQAPNKICIITDIGLDHMHILGHTPAEIAAQKAGIIHQGNEVFSYTQQADVDEVVKKRAEQQNAKLHTVKPGVAQNSDKHLRSLPLYQQRNWYLAKQVYDFVKSRDDLPELNDTQLAESMNVQVPGRMDIRHDQNKEIIMDGAHNEQKTEAFVKSFQAKYPSQKAAILLSMKQGKEYQSVLPLLKPICSRLVVTAYPKAQDLPTPAIQPELLAETAKQYGFENVLVEPDYIKAFKVLLDGPENLCTITGSFYLIANLRRVIK